MRARALWGTPLALPAPALLADLEILPQRLADHRRRGLVIPLGPLGRRFAEFGIEPDGLNAGGRRPDRWASPPAPKCFLDVVARLGLVGQLLDELVGDWLAAGGPAVGLLLCHRQPSGNSRRYLGRIFIAWMTSSEPSSRTIVTTSRRSALRGGPR